LSIIVDLFLRTSCFTAAALLFCALAGGACKKPETGGKAGKAKPMHWQATDALADDAPLGLPSGGVTFTSRSSSGAAIVYVNGKGCFYGDDDDWTPCGPMPSPT